MGHPENIIRYDTIIIGSGIGGSTAALLLAKYFNKKVLLLEKHWKFGGLTHEFEFDNKKFATGVHYIGSVENNSVPAKIFDILTSGKLQWKKMPHRFDEVIFPDHHFAIPSSPTEFIDELSLKYPDDAPAIRRFVKDSIMAFRYLTVHNATKSHMPGLNGISTGIFKILAGFDPNISLLDYINKHFKNEELKGIIASQWADHGVLPSEASFMVHAMIFNHYINGTFYPLGGVDSLNSNMKATLESNGVEIRLNTEVVQINTEKKKVTGVTVVSNAAGADTIYADHVISNAGATATYKRLLDHEHFDFLEKDSAFLSSNYDFFSVYLSLRTSPKELGFDGSNKWIYNTNKLDEQLLAFDENKGPNFYCLLFPSIKAGDEKNHTMEILSMVKYDKFEKWEDTHWKNRGNSYSDFKDKLAKRILKDIEKRYPGLADAINDYNISTPLTTKSFLSRDRGSSYGVPFTTKRSRLKWLSTRTPFKNLHISGQDAFAPGIMAAMMGGVSAAANTLGGLGYFRIMKEVTKHTVAQGLAEKKFLTAKVIERKQETKDAATFKLAITGADYFDYQSGQFIVIDVSIGGKSHKRSYSLSSFSDEKYPSITIKRVPNGIVSNHFLNHAFSGSEFHVSMAKGKLVIPQHHKNKNLVLIAAGSGITPLYSIMKDILVNCTYNHITLLYANRSIETTIFLSELRDLESEYPNYLTIKHFFSKPNNGLKANIISEEEIENALKRDEPSQPLVLVCAPKGIVKMAKKAADRYGLPEELFMYESFTTEPLNLEEVDIPEIESAVTLQISNKAHIGTIEKRETILKGLLDSKVPVDHSCMSGDCGLCACQIKAGEVVSLHEKKLTRKLAGEEILPCVSYANTQEIVLLKS